MQYQQSQNQYMINIEQGEQVIEQLTHFCRDHGIDNASITGIGAVKNCEVGAFELEHKRYMRQQLDGVYELLSAVGNVTLKDSQPFVHMHVTLCQSDLRVYGGHLFEMTVAVVGEFTLTAYETKIKREFDDNIGLATMRC